MDVTRWSIGFALCAGWGVIAAWGQEPEEPPTLPDTEVRATPDPAPLPFQPLPPDNLFNNSLIEQGTPFRSPEPEGYRATSSTTAAIVDVPDIDFAGTVNVITDQLRHDQQILRFDDALRNIGGAIKVNDQLRPDSLFIRGFEVRSRDFRKNGYADPTYTPRDFANVDRVEVLKGPASVLFGNSAPSGVINFITKKPLRDRYSNATYTFGEFDLNRVTVDTTGPANEDRTVLYRINTAYEDRGSFRDFGFTERTFVAPAVTWLIDEETQLTWEGEFLKDRRRYDTGLVLVGNDALALPPNRYLGEPGNDKQWFEDYRQQLFLERRIDDVWTFKVGGQSLFYTAPSTGWIPSGFTTSTADPPLTLDRMLQDIEHFNENDQSLIANLAAEFSFMETEHKLLFGTEQGWFHSDQFRSVNYLIGTTIDAANPVYTNPAPFPLGTSVFNSEFRQNRHGFYTQDIMKLNENWSFTAGLRYDIVDEVFARDNTSFGIPFIPPTDSEQSFNRLSPRAGVVYQPIPDVLAIYGTYNRSFNAPGGGPRATIEPLKAEIGELFEAGVKVEVFEGLSATFAGFHILRENVTVDTFSGPPLFFTTVQIGQQRSQGVEMNLAGQVTERWSVIGNWTYADTVINDDSNPAIDGQRARNVPLTSGSVWSRYNVVQNQQHTIGAALGLVSMSNRAGDLGDTFQLPGYTRWDSGLYYKRGRFDASLYVENMFDVHYISSSIGAFQLFPGSPSNARAQIGVTF